MIFILKLISAGSFLSFGLMFLTLRPGNAALITVNIALIGLFIVPIMPIGYYAAVELTRPVSEALSSGIIMLFGMVYGIGMIYVVSVTLENSKKEREEDQNTVRIILACALS